MLVAGRPCGFVYEGDFEEVARWIPFAQHALENIFNLRVPAKVIQPADGVLIQVQNLGTIGKIYIKAVGGLYLESGFIDLRNFAPMNLDTYRPGILNFNGHVASNPYHLLGKAPKPFEGKGLTNGQLSDVVNCSNKVAVVPDVGTSSGKEFCLGLIGRKRAMEFVPPSLFTGKMRLFVQALYGSKLAEGRLSVDEGSRTLNLDGEAFGWTEMITSGLYTSADHQYWKIDIFDTGITYRKVTLSATGKKWAATLVKRKAEFPAEKIDQIEAYIFSTAKFDERREVAYFTNGRVAGYGSALAYGWHFNWDGNRASIIRHDDDPDNVLNYRSTTFHIDITRDPITDRFSAAWVQGDRKIWRHYPAYQAIWLGESLSGVSYALAPRGPMTSWAPINSDADLYCYYQRNAYKAVHLTTSEETPAPSFIHNTYPTSFCGNPGTYVYSEAQNPGASGKTTGSQGFTIDGAGHTGSSIWTSTYQRVEFLVTGESLYPVWHEYGPYTGTQWNQCPGTVYPPYADGWNAQREFGLDFTWHVTTRVGVNDIYSATLGIPCFDSEAVFIGHRDKKASEQHSDVNLSPLYGYYSGVKFGKFIDPFHPELGVSTESVEFPAYFTPQDVPASPAGTVYRSKTLQIHAYGSHIGTTQVMQRQYSWTDVEPDDGLSDFFTVSYTSPILNGAMWAYSTSGGANLELIKAETKNNDFLGNQIPVGWV